MRGKPRRQHAHKIRPRVDPRVCGGNDPTKSAVYAAKGRSPRMRGKRCRPDQQPPAKRSIPAYAGETASARACGRGHQVDPRVCGGNPKRNEKNAWEVGRSPRMRGKQRTATELLTEHGSIPAYAGETAPGRRWRERRPVDPRVCGGNPSIDDQRYGRTGRSPRMRGKPLRAAIHLAEIVA